MAKGRKLTTSRSERYLGSFGGQGTAASSASELREEDVWSVADDAYNADGRSSSGGWGSRASSDGSRSFGGGGYRGRRGSPGSDHGHVGGLSLAFDHSGGAAAATQRIVHQYGVAESPRGRSMATSAPVNVPDWSKIYRVDSVESMHDSDDGGDEAELVPPHEYLAREYSRSRNTAANSVFEGVGRTLKGRDMSRVRDAVWSQTGFDG